MHYMRIELRTVGRFCSFRACARTDSPDDGGDEFTSKRPWTSAVVDRNADSRHPAEHVNTYYFRRTSYICDSTGVRNLCTWTKTIAITLVLHLPSDNVQSTREETAEIFSR